MPRTGASTTPSTPQRALRIYPVGTLIVDVTARERIPFDFRRAEARLAQPEERWQEAR